MGLEIIIEDLNEVDEAIGLCLKAKKYLPTLVLLYAGIDIVASLERRSTEEGTRASFIRWVEAYLLPSRPLGCTSVDLFAARCGILHTLTPVSTLSRKHSAREINYAWGTERTTRLQELLTRVGKTDVALHVDDLHEAFGQGVLAWFKDVIADQNRRRVVESASGAWFTNLVSPLPPAPLSR